MFVTAYGTPLADAYNNDAMNDPLAYLDAYDSSYEEEPTEYPQNMRDEEELYNDPRNASPDMPEPEAEAEEDLYGQESDVTENPEIPEKVDEEYDWPTNGMAGPAAEEYWNPEMTGLEDNEPSSTLHDQMTTEEVYEWLYEPSEQVVIDWYDRPDREDNKKRQRLCRLELWRNYWIGDLGPGF